MSGKIWLKPRVYCWSPENDWWHVECPHCRWIDRDGMRVQRTKSDAMHALAKHYAEKHGGDGALEDCDCAACAKVRLARKVST